MIYARVKDGIRVFFGVVRLGQLRAGVSPGDITLTVVAPDTTTSTTVAVSETSGKPGLYTALVPTAFLDTNGVGVYATVLEIDTNAPRIRDVKVDAIRVGKRDEDDIMRTVQPLLSLL